MNHLEKARQAIDRAQAANYHENATLIAQLAIAHALVALVECVGKMNSTGRERIDWILEHD